MSEPGKTNDAKPAAVAGTGGAAFGAQRGLDRTVEPASPPLKVAAWLCALIFCGAPLGQAAFELARGERVQALDYLKPFELRPAGRPMTAYAKELSLELVSAPRLRRFEDDLREASFVRQCALPWYQWGLAAWLGHGNKRSVVGRDGWLFYADDLESAYGKGYLEPGVGGREALAAIDDFKAQLDARAIELLLVPSYSKEMLDPEKLSRFTDDLTTAANPDLPAFYGELEKRGLHFVRMDELFRECRAQAADPRTPIALPRDTPLALPRDTHWTPQTMAFCARRIAEQARALLGEEPPSGPPLLTTKRVEIDGEGDLVRMLSLPPGQTLYPPMHLSLESVVDAWSGELVRPDETSDVLVMGDSLTRIFSDPELGLGEGAGLAEHLALNLGRPLDVIALAGGSATATRERLARRNDGLAGKRLVIWQFGVRMLAAGPDEWRLVKMPDPSAFPDVPPAVHPGREIPRDRVTIVGEIVETSQPGRNFDYPFCLLIYEYKIVKVIDGTLDGDRVWVGHVGVAKGKETSARRLPIGAKHRMILEDVRLRYDLEQVPYFDNTDAGRVIHFPVKWDEAK